MNNEIIKKFSVEKFGAKPMLNKLADITEFETIAFDASDGMIFYGD